MTAKVARRVFDKGNVYMQICKFGTFFTDDLFLDVYPADGQTTP